MAVIIFWSVWSILLLFLEDASTVTSFKPLWLMISWVLSIKLSQQKTRSTQSNCYCNDILLTIAIIFLLLWLGYTTMWSAYHLLWKYLRLDRAYSSIVLIWNTNNCNLAMNKFINYMYISISYIYIYIHILISWKINKIVRKVVTPWYKGSQLQSSWLQLPVPSQ